MMETFKKPVVQLRWTQSEADHLSPGCCTVSQESVSLFHDLNERSVVPWLGNVTVRRIELASFWFQFFGQLGKLNQDQGNGLQPSLPFGFQQLWDS